MKVEVACFAGLIAIAHAGCRYDYESAYRCNNGVRDGDEKGIDCGGSCDPCGITGRWENLATTGGKPPGRFGEALVYEAGAPGDVFLFSGYPNSLTDTWMLDDKTWSKKDPVTSPPGRNYAMAAHDAVLNRTIVAGGYSDDALDDTWAWNGTAWTKLANANLPGPRYGGCMVWDADDKKLRLIANSAGSEMREILELDSKTDAIWVATHLTEGAAPLDREYFGCAYDLNRHVTVLSDGNETWEYVSNPPTWTKMSAVGPGKRRGPGMTYDSDRGVNLFFGGQSKDKTLHSDLLEYDGSNWKTLTVENQPPARFEARLVYDVSRRRLILFGGADPSFNPRDDDTWALYWLGTNCKDASECGNGNCVDGVCCEYAACEVGEVCNNADSPGHCMPR